MCFSSQTKRKKERTRMEATSRKCGNGVKIDKEIVEQLEQLNNYNIIQFTAEQLRLMPIDRIIERVVFLQKGMSLAVPVIKATMEVLIEGGYFNVETGAH